MAGSYKNLLAQASINITSVREVKIKYENETVFIENIGNIPFEDEITFILESELRKYPVPKKISVEPGKTIGIDLSKEVPLGIYDITLPLKESLEPFREKLNETLRNILESGKEKADSLLPDKIGTLAANVTIHDNRPVYKKIGSGFSSVSGALVGADGVIARNPLVAPIVLFAVLLLLVFRYGRKPIMRLIRGRKGGGNSDNN